jgi:hypothetical protein
VPLSLSIHAIVCISVYHLCVCVSIYIYGPANQASTNASLSLQAHQRLGILIDDITDTDGGGNLE